MGFQKSGLLLLSSLAVLLASSAHAEDMPPLENYKPLPQLFDEKPIEADTAPFLTLLAPPQEKQEKSKSPAPPQKPVKAKKSPPAKASVKKVESARPPGKPSRTQIEDGHLANPNVRDILASIEGVKPAKSNAKGGISLVFVPGEMGQWVSMQEMRQHCIS